MSVVLRFCVILQEEPPQCSDLFFPFLALLHFPFPTTGLFRCYFQNWLSRSFSTALALSCVLSLLTLDDSYGNICGTHTFTAQVPFYVNPSHLLPNAIFFLFCYELSEIQLNIMPKKILSLQHLLLKQKKRKLTYFLFFFIFLLGDLLF